MSSNGNLVKRYPPDDGEPEEVYTMSLPGSGRKNSKIRHVVGSVNVEIDSNVGSWGTSCVEGKVALKQLRDALIEICNLENID